MLSYKSQYWHGLRQNPTFEEVLGTVDEPLSVPLPDPRAKLYANGNYQSLVLDAAKPTTSTQAPSWTMRPPVPSSRARRP